MFFSTVQIHLKPVTKPSTVRVVIDKCKPVKPDPRITFPGFKVKGH